MQLSKREKRQYDYKERSRTARSYARLLMPVTAIVLGTAAWQDPDLGPKLDTALAELRPEAARLVAETPLEDLLRPILADEFAALN
jgi:hypothetical protein